MSESINETTRKIGIPIKGGDEVVWMAITLEEWSDDTYEIRAKVNGIKHKIVKE